jgi:ABC-type spermidine/putrescine transport system permease subunit II
LFLVSLGGKATQGARLRYLRVYSVLLLLFLWLPLLGVLAKGLSLEAFSQLLANRELLHSFQYSLGLALATGVLATIFGLATAFALPRLSPFSQRWIMASLLLPLVLPEIALAIGFLVWFLFLGLPLGGTSLLIAHIGFVFCFVVLIIRNGVSAMDYSLVDAALDLGASPWQVFRHGILPQILPSCLASFVLAFSLSLDDFLVSFFTKGMDSVTLPVKLFSAMRLKIGEDIYALSLVLFAISLLSVVSSMLWQKRSFS